MTDRPVFDAVKGVLDRFDPESLLAMGAPSDEHSPEAEAFAERLRRGEQLTPDLVTVVWIGWFYEDCGLVRQSLAVLQRHCWTLARVSPLSLQPGTFTLGGAECREISATR